MIKIFVIISLLLGSSFINAQENKAKLAFRYGDLAFSKDQLERAIDYYSRAIDYYSRDGGGDFLEAYFKRGLARISAKKFEDAIKDFEKCIQTSYNIQEAKKNKDIAISEKEKAPKTEMGSGVQAKYLSEQFYKEAINLYAKGNFEKALSFFDSAVKMDPMLGDAFAFKALINFRLKKYQDTIIDCEKAIEKESYLKDAKICDVYFNRGSAYNELEKYEDALQDLNRAINLDDSHSNYFTVRGIVNYKLENNAKACEDWKTAVKKGDMIDSPKLLEKFCK